MQRSELHTIRNLDELESRRRRLRRQADREGRALVREAENIQASWRNSLRGFFRIRNILHAVLPKVELLTLLTPFIKRIFSRRKRV